MPIRKVAIALGANLGNRLSQLQIARDLFKRDCAEGEAWMQSAVFHTSPKDCPEDAPAYLNAVISFDYKGGAEELLTYCKAVEVQLGRLVDGSSGVVNLPRVIDADILFVGREEHMLPHLIVPHPRLQERRFVLEPLAQICADVILPTQTASIQEMLQELNSDEPALVTYCKDW